MAFLLPPTVVFNALNGNTRTVPGPLFLDYGYSKPQVSSLTPSSANPKELKHNSCSACIVVGSRSITIEIIRIYTSWVVTSSSHVHYLSIDAATCFGYYVKEIKGKEYVAACRLLHMCIVSIYVR